MPQTILSTLSSAERLSIAGTYSLTLLENLCVLTVAEQNRLGRGTWIVLARAEMTREMVGFFEADVPAIPGNHSRECRGLIEGSTSGWLWETPAGEIVGFCMIDRQ
jgi:hypothetical protein